MTRARLFALALGMWSATVGVASLYWMPAAVAHVSAAARDETAILRQTPVNIAPAQCTNGTCHAKEKDWSVKQDGDGKGKQHIFALDQLSVKRFPAVRKYADALNIKDVYATNGRCVACHGTVVRTSVNDGITCQSCHGPGSLYNKPHQEKGAYANAAIPLPGLRRFKNSPGPVTSPYKDDGWARMCIDCHVLGNDPSDAALVNAGHTSGVGETDFKLSAKFTTIAQHWENPKKHTSNAIAQFDGLRDKNAARIASVATPPSTPVPPPPVAVNPTPAAPVTPTGVNPPPTPPLTPTGMNSPPPPAVSPTGVKPTPPPPVPPTGVKPTPPPPVPPTVASPPPMVPAPPVATAPMGVLMSPIAALTSFQGRLIALLDALLRQGVTRQVANQPSSATTYTGPNAELLRLQQEVIALAIQALALPPPKTSKPDETAGGTPPQ